MKSLMSQSSDNAESDGATACRQPFFALTKLLPVWVSAVMPPQRNAAARRNAIVDFTDLNKCFMVKSPFMFEVKIRITGFRQITIVLLRKYTKYGGFFVRNHGRYGGKGEF